MQLTPHPTFSGQCEAAFKFYERCLGCKIVTMQQKPPEPKPTIHQIFEDSRKERNNAIQSNRDELWTPARAHDVE